MKEDVEEEGTELWKEEKEESVEAWESGVWPGGAMAAKWVKWKEMGCRVQKGRVGGWWLSPQLGGQGGGAC